MGRTAHTVGKRLEHPPPRPHLLLLLSLQLFLHLGFRLAQLLHQVLKIGLHVVLLLSPNIFLEHNVVDHIVVLLTEQLRGLQFLFEFQLVRPGLLQEKFHRFRLFPDVP